MKKKFSKILAVLLTVCMLPLPLTALPASAATAVDYDDAVDGDLLYKVDFTGDSVFNNPKGGWASATVTTSQTSVVMSTKSSSGRLGSVWGADLKGFTILNKSYTVVFTLEASDDDERIGFLPDDWAGFIITPGQNAYEFITTKNDGYEDSNSEGRYEGVITSGTYEGTNSLKQTYAIEFKTSGTESDPSVDAYNLYVEMDGEWVLVCSLTDAQMDESYFDWFYYDNDVYEEDLTMRFYRRYYKLNSSGYTTSTRDETQKGTVTVSDAKVYKGLVATNSIAKAPISGDLLYKVNFNGDKNMSKPEQAWSGGLSVSTGDGGNSISLTISSSKDSDGKVRWAAVGSKLENLYVQNGAYTFVFTVTASDNNEEIGICLDHATGFVVNPGQNTFRYTTHLQEKSLIETTKYDGTGELTQTYAIEVAGEGEGNNSKDQPYVAITTYKLYNLTADNEWNLACALSDEQLNSFLFDWGDAGDCNGYFYSRLSRDRRNYPDANNNKITVSDFMVYEGLAVTKALEESISSIYYQKSKDGSKVRIIGAVDFTEEELKNYANLGFNVTMTFGGRDYTNTFTTTTVYTSLVADGKTIYASEYGSYFFAVEITDLEFAAADDVVFQVEGFATKLDETIENVLGSKKIKIDGDPLSILPAFEGYSKTDTDTGDDCYMRSFGEVYYSDFEDYCDEIAESGFELYAEKTLEDNVYKTYVNKRYVVTTIYTAYNSYGKVLVEPRVGTALPTKAEDNVYNPIAGVDTTITQVGLYYGSLADTYNGMSYVVQLNDGSFIVVDGGFAYEGYADRLYSVLKKQAPDPDNIVIAAWIISHAHDDHVDVFESFFESYGDKVTVERFICNLPEAGQLVDNWSNERDGNISYTNKMREFLYTTLKDIPKVKAHPGQEFNIRNVKIDILYTIDIYDYDNKKLDDFNNTSVVFKLTAEGKSMLFLGDYDDKAYTMKNLYTASTLNSDIVQVAHHGLPENSSGALYQLITPEYVL